MNFAEYQNAAMRTAGDLNGTSQLDGLITTALGLCGETAELCDEILVGRWVNRELITKEFGDCFWYVARGCEALGVGMDGVFKLDVSGTAQASDLQASKLMLRTSSNAGSLADVVKKSHAQGHPVNTLLLVGRLKDYCLTISKLLAYCQLTPDLVMEANIAKLKERFPDGFDSQVSRARYQVVADQKRQQAEAVLVAKYGSITEGLGDN